MKCGNSDVDTLNYFLKIQNNYAYAVTSCESQYVSTNKTTVDSGKNKVCVDKCGDMYSEQYYPVLEAQGDGMYKCAKTCP